MNANNIAALARTYNVLEYPEKLRRMLSNVYCSENLNEYNKPGLHWLISELLLDHYRGESTLKAKLVKLFIQKDVTAAFEIKVHNSRVDFLTINGDTKSFEIKSELDNLQKLEKQIKDYQKVFDYNYIVIDEKHYDKAMKLIPERYGVMVLHGNTLSEDRSATRNEILNPILQLSLFTKKELTTVFKIPNTTAQEIDANFEPEEVAVRFKDMLKKRYTRRWEFLKINESNICPIDYQYFFQHNIEPKVIYGIS